MIACFLFGVQYCCVSCSWCLFLRVPLCTCCVCFAFTLNGVLAKKLQKKTKSKNESPCCLLLSLMMLCGRLVSQVTLYLVSYNMCVRHAHSGHQLQQAVYLKLRTYAEWFWFVFAVAIKLRT